MGSAHPHLGLSSRLSSVRHAGKNSLKEGNSLNIEGNIQERGRSFVTFVALGSEARLCYVSILKFIPQNDLMNVKSVGISSNGSKG